MLLHTQPLTLGLPPQAKRNRMLSLGVEHPLPEINSRLSTKIAMPSERRFTGYWPRTIAPLRPKKRNLLANNAPLDRSKLPGSNDRRWINSRKHRSRNDLLSPLEQHLLRGGPKIQAKGPKRLLIKQNSNYSHHTHLWRCMSSRQMPTSEKS